MKTYLFDVDGVLTNPENREEINQTVFLNLVKLLEHGIPLSFITGRGMTWLREKFIIKIEKCIEDHPSLDKRILDLLYVSGEFGGVTLEHTNGIRQEFLKKEFELPEKLQVAIIKEINNFKKYVFIEEGKQTILTIRTNFNLRESEAQRYKNEIITCVNSLLIHYPDIEAQADLLSVNIRCKNANKKYATDQCVLWLERKGYTPDTYYVFGDSPTDLEMGEELKNKQLPFKFIFVGKKRKLEGVSYTFPVTVTTKHYDDGLLEYLSAKDSS